MGFLEAVGKSGGVGQLGQNFLGNTLQAGRFMQDAETHRLAQQEAQIKLQQAEKDNKEYHVDAVLSMYPENDRPFVKEVLTTAGKIRPDGIVVGKDVREVPRLFEAYPKVAIGRGSMEFESLAKENEKLSKKGDPQSQQQMIANAQRMTEIRKSIALLSGKDSEDKITSVDPTHDVYQGGKKIATGTPKQEVAETFFFIGGDNGEYQVNKMKDGTYVHADTGAPYEGDFSILKKVAGERPPSQSPVNEAMALWDTRNPGAPPAARQKELERLMTLGPSVRANAFSAKPTNTPGVFFDSISKKYFRNTEGGAAELSSDEVKKLNLQFKEETPVNDIKVMQQTAPAVLGLSKSVRESINGMKGKLGPASSRWREFWAGKIGSSDPEFIKLRTNVGLLETRLMKMHVGASGGEYIIKHFKELIAEGKRSPENMIAALDAIDVYAEETEQSKFGGAGTGGSAAPKKVKVWNPATKSFDER